VTFGASLAVVIALFAAVVPASAKKPQPQPPAPPPAPPASSGVTADFSYQPRSPKTGETVTFQSTSQATGAGNRIVSYEWDLDGDGGFETTGPATVSRSYPTAREITVKLRVTDAANHAHTDVASRKVKIANRPPAASFQWSPNVPHVSEPVAFSSTSSDPDGKVIEQAWDLDGDGKYDNGGGSTALRSFSSPGTYLVRLKVTDDRGASSYVSQPISVAATDSAAPAVTNQRSGLRLINPFPIVRIAGWFTSTGTRIRLLVVNAPRGAKVTIRCKGGGCPFKRQVRLASRVRVKKLERVLRAGTKIRVYITQRGLIGKYTSVKIRAGKAPARRDLCLAPGSWRKMRCPGL
jgi:PKD repeat protein